MYVCVTLKISISPSDFIFYFHRVVLKIHRPWSSDHSVFVKTALICLYLFIFIQNPAQDSECITSKNNNFELEKPRTVFLKICKSKYIRKLKGMLFQWLVPNQVQNNTLVNFTVWRTIPCFLKWDFLAHAVPAWSSDNQFYTQPVQVHVYRQQEQMDGYLSICTYKNTSK